VPTISTLRSKPLSKPAKFFVKNYALPPDIHYKGDVDLVTQADRRSDGRLSRASLTFS